MSNRTKQRRSGGLTLLLYQRTLHPELFKILATETGRPPRYEADIWLVEGGHVITFTAGKNTLAEVIVTNSEPLHRPRPASVDPLPRRKVSRDDRRPGNIRYMISTQEEQLTQTLVRRHQARDRQLRRQARADDGRDPVRRMTPAQRSASLDIERRSHELLVQSFHLFDENQMVIKTQAIIEVVRGA